MIDNMYIERYGHVNLLSAHSEDGRCLVKFGDGREFRLSTYKEREYCTAIFSYGPKSDAYNFIARNLRNDFFPDIDPGEIDDFFIQFRKLHQPFDIEKCQGKIYKIPVLSEEEESGGYCVLHVPEFQYPIKINREWEMKMIELCETKCVSAEYWYSLPNGYTPRLYDRLVEICFEYREKYGLEARYKKDQKGQDGAIATEFCYQHGLNIDELCDWNVTIKAKDWWYGKSFLSRCIGYFELGALIYSVLFAIFYMFGRSSDNIIMYTIYELLFLPIQEGAKLIEWMES